MKLSMKLSMNHSRLEHAHRVNSSKWSPSKSPRISSVCRPGTRRDGQARVSIPSSRNRSYGKVVYDLCEFGGEREAPLRRSRDFVVVQIEMLMAFREILSRNRATRMYFHDGMRDTWCNRRNRWRMTATVILSSDREAQRPWRHANFLLYENRWRSRTQR